MEKLHCYRKELSSGNPEHLQSPALYSQSLKRRQSCHTYYHTYYMDAVYIICKKMWFNSNED